MSDDLGAARMTSRPVCDVVYFVIDYDPSVILFVVFGHFLKRVRGHLFPSFPHRSAVLLIYNATSKQLQSKHEYRLIFCYMSSDIRQSFFLVICFSFNLKFFSFIEREKKRTHETDNLNRKFSMYGPIHSGLPIHSFFNQKKVLKCIMTPTFF